jgi:hypothetical protein
MDGGNEGGELVFGGAGANSATTIDNHTGNFRFGTGGGIRLTIDSEGRIGFGVTPNANWINTFRVFDMGGNGAGLYANPASSTVRISSNTYYDGTAWKAINTGLSSGCYANGTTAGCFTNPSVTAGTAVSTTPTQFLVGDGTHNWYVVAGAGATAMHMNSAGNLAIGSNLVPKSTWATSNNVLEIGGATNPAFVMSATAGNDVMIGMGTYFDGAWKNRSTTASSFIRLTSGTVQLWSGAAGAADVATSPTQKITMNVSGYLGIGVTAPAIPLEVYRAPSDTLGDGSIALNYNAGAGSSLFTQRLSATTYDWCLDRSTGGTWYEAIRVQRTSGYVGIGGTPTTKFEVFSGRTTLHANSEAYALQLNYTTTKDGPYLGSPAADVFSISTSGGTERMRIAANGMSIYNASIAENISTPAISTGTLTLDFAASNFFNVTLNANITGFTFNNFPTASKFYNFIIEFKMDGTLRTIAWTTFKNSAAGNVTVLWPNGTAPTITSTLNKKDVYSFYTYDQGATWIGMVLGQNI